jgi:hypothetical protein
MSDIPLVSVVTATFNMAHYLREAVDSVLAQDWPEIEMIVVDDGSTDDTPEVLTVYADDPRVTVIRQANAGQTKAKNAGLRAVRGEYVGFCDADNAWVPGKLCRQLPLLRANPGAGVVYGDVTLIGATGEPLGTPRVKRWNGRITGRLLADNFVTFNTVLVRRAVLEEFRGFDESLSMAIDYDLWLRISTKYAFLYVSEVLAQYRIWPGQMSHRTGERLDNAFRLMQNFLQAYPESVTASERRRAWAHTYVSRAYWRASQGQLLPAASDLRRAAGQRPWDLRLWRTALTIGRDVVTRHWLF